MDWNRFRTEVDNYITREDPEIHQYNDWCEDVMEHWYKGRFGEIGQNYPTCFEETESDWMNKLYDQGKLPEEAAEIIERAYFIHIYNED